MPLVFSFEVSAVDIVLAVAVIILFILHLTRSSAESSTRTESYLAGRNVQVHPRAQASSTEMRKPSGQTDAWKCTHSYGYLGNLPKDASIPNECLTCPRVMECSSRG